MKSTKKIKPVDTREIFKLKIDYRTIITVRTKEALKSWMARYPKAELVV